MKTQASQNSSVSFLLTHQKRNAQGHINIDHITLQIIEKCCRRELGFGAWTPNGTCRVYVKHYVCKTLFGLENTVLILVCDTDEKCMT